MKKRRPPRVDNRARPRIHRCDDAHDAKIRAYAREHGVEPWRALELMIDAAEDLAHARKVASDLRAELAQAREATRRAEEQIEQLTRALAGERLKTEAAQAREQEARTETALRRKALDPALMARVQARITSRPGRDFAFVLENGCSRLEASDDYQDRKKAARAAKKGA